MLESRGSNHYGYNLEPRTFDRLARHKKCLEILSAKISEQRRGIQDTGTPLSKQGPDSMVKIALAMIGDK